MNEINFQKTYYLGDSYAVIKDRIIRKLNPYLNYPSLILFNDQDGSVVFQSERLIPENSGKKPRVMLLFSNPHPHSIYRGMFLSPNTKNTPSLFWPIMAESGWLITEKDYTPAQLADICLKAEYQSPFELIFYCYYAFPSDYPEDLAKIFGKEYFNRYIEPDAKSEFYDVIKKEAIQAVLVFNKNIFNLVAVDRYDRYIKRLNQGDLLKSRIKNTGDKVPVFLTYPTGWCYHRLYRQYRVSSLSAIVKELLPD